MQEEFFPGWHHTTRPKQQQEATSANLVDSPPDLCGKRNSANRTIRQASSRSSSDTITINLEAVRMLIERAAPRRLPSLASERKSNILASFLPCSSQSAALATTHTVI